MISDEVIWSVLLRMTQAGLQASPTILVGLFVAALFRRLLGPEHVRRLFGDQTWHALVQAWGIGMLLPVCSLGVVPVVREMRRAGISGGTILAFALAASLFNPLSLLYGLTLSEPFTILAFATGSLIVVTVAGWSWDHWFPGTGTPETPPRPVEYGGKRLLAILVSAIRESTSVSLGYMVVGVLGVGLLAFCLPPGALQRSMNYDNPWAPLTMSAIAVPAYATPMLAMSQLGSMFQHGNSVGAAFALLTLGAGMNLGLAAWMVHSYGWRRSVVWIGLLFGVVLTLSYGIERPLYPANVEAADHTHAFDVYCQPFHQSDVPSGEGLYREALRQGTQFYEVWAAAAISILVVAGLGLRWLDRKWRIEDWLETPRVAEKQVGGKWDVVVPPPVLGGVGLVGLVAVSIVGCYAFYPPASEVLEEIRIVKGEAIVAANTGDHKVAAHWIEVWDDWTRKLQVSVFLRRGELSAYHRMKAKILREKLELLEHESADGDREAVQRMTKEVLAAHQRLYRAYTEEL